MAEILNFAGERFAFDLVWHQVPDLSSSTLKGIADDARGFVPVKSSDGYAVGFFHDPEEPKGVLSFAALIANLFPDDGSCLYFEDLGDGNAIMAAINFGLPVPNMDRYGDVDELIGLALDHITENRNVRVFGKNCNLEGVSEVDIGERLASKDGRKALSESSLRKVGQGAINTKVLFYGLAILGVLGYIGNDQYEEYQRKKAAELAAANAVAKKSPEQIYLESLPAAIAAEGLSKKGAIESLRVINGVRTSVAGWDTKSVTCDTGGCLLNMSKSFLQATMDDLQRAMGGYQVKFTTDSAATILIPVQAPQFALDRASLPKAFPASLKLTEVFHRYSSKISATASQPAPVIAGGVTLPNGVMKSAIKINGPIWLLQLLNTLPETVSVKSITVTNNGIASTANIDLTSFGTN